MLDGLLGRGFSSKCKSLIKMTKTRVDAIKRKRNAMQKYLKKDIADLLANGLDINAYGRADGLSIELNLSSCYEYIEQLCDFILKHLSVMQKQRECPEVCGEAISSLMFAAARFADLPELRDLRDTFTERYGNTLESFVNKEFVECLASKPPITEKKIQLMQEIAEEFHINWDSKAFVQKIVNSPLPAQDQFKRKGSSSEPRTDENKLYNGRSELPPQRGSPESLYGGKQGPFDDGYVQGGNREASTLNRDNLTNARRVLSDYRYRLCNVKEVISKNDNHDVLSRCRQEVADNRYKQHRGKEETIRETENKCTVDGKPHKARDDIIPKRDNIANPYRRRQKHDNGHEMHRGRDDTVCQREKHENLLYKEQNYPPMMKQKMKIDREKDIPSVEDNHQAPHNLRNLQEKASKVAESMKTLPPPYLKPSGAKHTPRSAIPDQANKAAADDMVNGGLERSQVGLDHEERVVGPVRISGDDDLNYQDKLVGDKNSKAKSVRRRHLKPSSRQDYSGNNEGVEIVKRHRNGRRRVELRQGLQVALDIDDEEERMMDKLLLHYSKKASKFETPIKIKGRLNAPMGHRDAAESQSDRTKDEVRSKLASVPPPSRAVSLPPGQVPPPTSTARLPARATSFQPEMMNPGGHVHPRLPDYDDLASRFAALRGR